MTNHEEHTTGCFFRAGAKRAKLFNDPITFPLCIGMKYQEQQSACVVNCVEPYIIGLAEEKRSSLMHLFFCISDGGTFLFWGVGEPS